MKTAEAPQLAMEQIREWLVSQGLALKEGHITGYSSGGMVAAEHLKKAMENYELYYAIVHKIGDPKNARVRLIERPTIDGLPIQWADGDLED